MPFLYTYTALVLGFVKSNACDKLNVDIPVSSTTVVNAVNAPVPIMSESAKASCAVFTAVRLLMMSSTKSFTVSL